MFSFPAHAPTAVFTLSLHDALPIARPASGGHGRSLPRPSRAARPDPTELRGTLCPAGGPAVDLEAESCPGTPPRPRQAAAPRLGGGHRLPLPARPGPRPGARSGPGLVLGPPASEPFSDRTDRDRQELSRLCAGRKGLPGWVHRLVHAGRATVPRLGSGARRR